MLNKLILAAIASLCVTTMQAQDLTIKKLTRNNPTMKQKFEEVRGK